MALLNGRTIADDKINPAKHKFIGTFRPPSPEQCIFHGKEPAKYNRHCTCQYGSCWGMHNIVYCWENGHFDQPQYVSIKK